MTPASDRELTFMDLVVLQRIGPDTTLERFGSKINSSYFDAANILGTIKLKGYVDIESAIGASKVSVSDGGKAVLAMAEEKSQGEIDSLDRGILAAVSRGTKEVDRIGERLNVRSADLAYHIYKLVKNNYIDYDLRAGKVSVMLTESGFNNAGGAVGAEEPGDETLGAEIAKEGEKPAVPRPEGKEPDVGVERAKTKSVYYMKRWGKYAAIALVLIIILLIVFIWFYMQNAK